MEAGIVFAIVAAIFYFSGKKLAQKLYQTTGYYAYGKLNLFLAATVGLPIILMLINGDAFDKTSLLMFIGFACIPLAILVVRNLKLKNPVTIIAMTVIQVLAGGIAVFALFSIFALRIAGVNVGGISGGVPSPNMKINNIEAADRARQQQSQQAHQQQQYQKGFDMGRESTPYDSMPGGLSQEAQDGYQEGERR